ncbi:MAG: ECF-type sigma factor [Luteimonas sp.]|nr:ECF-type sigma factor [Luteimonas sp.]
MDDAQLVAEADVLDSLQTREMLVAVDELMPLLYEELRATARRERRRIVAGDTLATTALVSELYLRLARSDGFGTRGHFLAVAAIAMRRILIERVRAQLRIKRGAGAAHLPVDDEVLAVADDAQVLVVHEGLQKLALRSPRMAQVVECRYFAGYTDAETAEALGVSERTVRRDWLTARAWLQRELG